MDMKRTKMDRDYLILIRVVVVMTYLKMGKSRIMVRPRGAKHQMAAVGMI